MNITYLDTTYFFSMTSLRSFLRYLLEPILSIILTSSLVKSKPSRTDIIYKFVPMTEIAHKSGHEKMANIVSLGAFIKAFPVVTKEGIVETMKKKLTGKKAQMFEGNVQALEEGFASVN